MSAPTELRELLRHDVERSVFRVVLEYLDARDSESGRRRAHVKQAAEATEIGLREFHGGVEPAPKLAPRFER
jgi:hypothetical protein